MGNQTKTMVARSISTPGAYQGSTVFEIPTDYQIPTNHELDELLKKPEDIDKEQK